jgi:hypothetical protein
MALAAPNHDVAAQAAGSQPQHRRFEQDGDHSDPGRAAAAAPLAIGA